MEKTKDIMKEIRACIKELIEDKVCESLNKTSSDEKIIYNESSFQYELAKKIEHELNNGEEHFRVQLERNIITFPKFEEQYKKLTGKAKKENIEEIKAQFNHDELRKRVIDILILDKETHEKYAIELKYHRKELGEVPDFIYNCITDMWFLKRMIEKEYVKGGFCVVVTEDKDIYNNDREKSERKNYEHFKEKNEMKIPESEIVREAKILTKEDEKWECPYNVVKKIKNNKENKYYYINTTEFYTEANNTKLIEWEKLDKNNKQSEARYYIKEFLN